MTQKHVQITDFDPLDLATAADPYPHYRVLLAGERVHYNPKRDVYILSRYCRRPRGCARPRRVVQRPRSHLFPAASPFLPTSDPPAHTRLRKQLTPGLTRGALDSWRPMVDQLAREFVGELLMQTPADIVSTVAAPMTMRTITNVLGLGADEAAAFRRLSDQAIRITDVNLFGRGLVSLMHGFTGFRRLRALFTTPAATTGCWARTPCSASSPRTPSRAGSATSELSLFAVLLMVAGYETTANMISTLVPHAGRLSRPAQAACASDQI